ncbi:MAG TPA: GNAT family N-acetyltransferase [Streptosporangiaceae bacterium]|nr:GNAT family N-acetyltransferase [Streptosporangiaceae bacterium]
MDRMAAIAAYNQQVRHSTAPEGTGVTFEVDGPVIRRLAPPGQEGSGVFWSDLDAGNADAVIAEQVAIFGARGEEFEWKLYDYDQPSDLAERLLAAGFEPEDPESFMVAETAEVLQALSSANLPEGVVAVPVTDAPGLALMAQVEQQAFGRDKARVREGILAQLEATPDQVALVLAMAGDVPVCACRIEYVPGTEFAGLWGGGTVKEWRGRGIYRALVRYRAELATKRGYTYLTVDASEDSRPILERVGFTRLAVTTPYIWTPPS